MEGDDDLVLMREEQPTPPPGGGWRSIEKTWDASQDTV